MPSLPPSPTPPATSLLAWPAWRRVLVLAPLLLLLWVATAWALGESAPW